MTLCDGRVAAVRVLTDGDGRGSWREGEELGEVATVQGEVLNLLLFHDGAELGGGAFDLYALGLDLDSRPSRRRA